MRARPILTVAVTLAALVMAGPAWAAQKKPHTEVKRVTRDDPKRNRHVELERRITTQKGQPTRNVYNRQVSRTTRLPGGDRQTVTLNKTFVNLDGKRKSVDYDRKVEITKAPQHPQRPTPSRGYGSTRPSSSYCYTPPTHRYNPPTYRQNRPPTPTYSPYRRSYHQSSGWSIGVSVSDNNLRGSIYYGSGYGDRCSPCSRCSGGYYQRVWVQPVYIVCYDSCGRSYRKLVRCGYYRQVWLPHRHPCSGW